MNNVLLHVHVTAARKRPTQGEFVGIFEVATDRQTRGDAGDGEAEWLQESRKV